MGSKWSKGIIMGREEEREDSKEAKYGEKIS